MAGEASMDFVAQVPSPIFTELTIAPADRAIIEGMTTNIAERGVLGAMAGLSHPEIGKTADPIPLVRALAELSIQMGKRDKTDLDVGATWGALDTAWHEVTFLRGASPLRMGEVDKWLPGEAKRILDDERTRWKERTARLLGKKEGPIEIRKEDLTSVQPPIEIKLEDLKPVPPPIVVKV